MSGASPVPAAPTCSATPCDGCGGRDQVVTVVTALGDRLCRRCWASTTSTSSSRQPATPGLDRWLAERDRTDP
jgi:recombinational DNA repair protein (RecF pathway)